MAFCVTPEAPNPADARPKKRNRERQRRGLTRIEITPQLQDRFRRETRVRCYEAIRRGLLNEDDTLPPQVIDLLHAAALAENESRAAS